MTKIIYAWIRTPVEANILHDLLDGLRGSFGVDVEDGTIVIYKEKA